MKKHSVFLVLAVLVCFVLTGCAKIDYTYLNNGNKITQVFSVELDSELLTENGINPLDVKTIINEKIYKHFQTYEASLKSSANELMVNGKISVALANKIKEEAVVVEGPIWLNNVVSVQVTFKSVSDEVQTINYQNIYYLYYEHDLYPTIQESKIETEGLLRKLSETDYSIFNSNIAEEYRESVSTALTESGITLESEPQYSYTYGTTYRRVHSDADDVSYDGEYYLHCWNLDSADEQITLYRLYSNQWIWYVIAIAAALITVAVLSVINAIKKKKAKKVEVEIISPLK